MTASQLDNRLIEDVRDLTPLIRAHEAEIDASRQLPQAILDAFHELGLFRASLSPRLGGLGCDPITVARVVEEIGRANGSAGWCVMVANQIAAGITQRLSEQA